MYEVWQKLISGDNIRNRILARGISLTVVPLTIVLITIWITNGVANYVSVTGCSRLADQDLNHIVKSLIGACRLYNSNLSNAVNGARTVLERAGPIQLDASEGIPWQAKNQVTSEVSPIRLPLMRVGGIAIRPLADFSREAPIVDEVQALYQLSATVFQRMNERGDMLRIATNVKKTDGTRAIGTFIPALLDGKPNPVVATVLKGQTYVGRAFVVNAWYITAYQPLKDSAGNIIGVIYTGMPEMSVRDRIIQFRDLAGADSQASIFILHTAAKERGLFVLSSDPSLQSHNAWNYRDGHGDLYIQEICKKAVANKDLISESSYWSTGKASEKIITRYSYFPAWDWVIGVQETESEFLATPNQIKQIFAVSNYLPLVLVLLAALIAISVWKKLTNQMTAQIAAVMRSLERSSKQVAQALEAISGNADSVGAGAEQLSQTTQHQASAAEETSASTSMIANAAKRNSEAAERMLALATSAEGAAVEAKKTMLNVEGAMQSILSTNDEALSIIDTINEISFATNIVALNASVEASKAGEAGRTFVFIADEVRALAGKVAVAAQETRKIINNSRGELNKGKDFVAKLGTALNPMNENADQVRKLAGGVSSTSLNQSRSMQEVLGQMEAMRKSSEQAAQSALQGMKDAADLRCQVSALSASVRTVDQAVGKLKEEFLGVD